MDFNRSNKPEPTVKILGYCNRDEDYIRGVLCNGLERELLNMKGEYTIVFEQGKRIGIITSYIGAIQYFYYYDGVNFAHGASVLDIICELNLAWEWDWESVGDLCEQENLTENRTLHKSVRKVPAGTLLLFDNRLWIESIRFLDTVKEVPGNPLDAINILNEETIRWIGKDPVLSLSGGFDSRVILSSLLKQGVYPRVLTVGNEGNSDIEVAKLIANEFSLEHLTVNLGLDDLIENGERISLVTNGTKPACHWNTFLYPKKAGMSKNHSFFVGTLGEFARSYYFDKGFLSLLSEGFSKYSRERFWQMKLKRHRTFKDKELLRTCDGIRDQINSTGIIRRARRNAELSKDGFTSGGSRYYLEQRVPHFYANGIAMYNESTSWRSPFHNIEWLKIIWCLAEQWKLGSNWHRLAISKNFPKLLDFSEEKGFSKIRMQKRAAPLYWLPIMQRMKYKSYDLSGSWYQDNRIRELILDNDRQLGEYVERSLCEEILHEHKERNNRTRTISFILTILFYRINLHRRGK